MTDRLSSDSGTKNQGTSHAKPTAQPTMLQAAASAVGGAVLQRKIQRRREGQASSAGDVTGNAAGATFGVGGIAGERSPSGPDGLDGMTGGPGPTVLGVTLTAEGGATQFLALESVIPKDKLGLLHDAAKTGGGAAVATMLQGFVPEGLSGDGLVVLRGFADHYAAWVVAPNTNTAAPAVDGRLTKYKKGFVYDGGAGNQYLDSLGDVPTVLQDVLLPGDPDKQVEIFKFVTHTEGGISAINTWDDQIVTIGAGFGAKYKKAGSVYLKMPREFHDRLAEQGIAIKPDGSFTVRRDDGSLAEGEAALELLRKDVTRLSLFIQLAESTEQMGQYTSREWMLRAQFQQFLEPLAPYWSTIRAWDPGVVKVATKMVHWQPGVVTWPRLIKWYDAGGADAMFSHVRAAIVKFHGNEGDFSDDAVKGRLEKRASQAGISIKWVTIK